MCSGFLPDDRRLSVQIKSAFKSLMNSVKSFISGKSKNVIVGYNNKLAIENPVETVKLSV